MENDPLSTYLDALARDDCYRVDRVLKETPYETTEVVFFVGANNAALGPFVRKRISGDVPLGGAYQLLFEAQRAGRRFRYLPRIYDVHERDSDLVVVMEYVAGRTLRDEVYARDASPALACELFPRLCDAASELHEGLLTPIIHRDLKPSNIVVNDGGLTIIDFGIARSFREGAERDTTHFGTRSYAPPEQFGYGQTDVRSDVYALGMILYYLLTERDPDPAVAAEGFSDDAVPVALRPVLMRACAFDPRSRYRSARDLKAAFLAATTDAPVLGAPVESAAMVGMPAAAPVGPAAAPAAVPSASAAVPVGPAVVPVAALSVPSVAASSAPVALSAVAPPSVPVPAPASPSPSAPAAAPGSASRAASGPVSVDAPVPSSEKSEIAQRIGTVKVSEVFGLIWDIVVALIWALFAVICIGCVLFPSEEMSGCPLWYLALVYLVGIGGGVTGIAYALLDKRVLRRAFVKLERQTFLRGLVVGGAIFSMAFTVMVVSAFAAFLGAVPGYVPSAS